MRIYNMDYDIYEVKRDFTVIKYRKEIKKLSNKIDKKQIKFAEQVSDEFFYKSNNKINVYTARCGMGKSELIKAFLYNLVNNTMCFGKPNFNSQPMPFGAIVITDNLERLEKIMQYKGLEKRCYLMKWDKKDTATQERKEFKEQLKEQYKYPILLMSTQKYFRMSKEERNSIYSWYKGKREICIFDERPILVNSIEINEEFLSKIRIALDMIFESKDKQYLIKTYKKIYEDIDYIRESYSNKYEVMWLNKSRETLLYNKEEDKLFFEILGKHVSYDILEKCKMLRKIYKDGALFVNKKNKEQLNTRNIILLNDNIECFDIEKCKYHILDATAKFDIDYVINKNYFNYIEIDDVKEHKDINLIHVPISSSQNRFKQNKGIKSICNWINREFKEGEVFVATYSYKTGIYNKFANNIKQEVEYFGNIKGTNKYEDKKTMIQIGMNRQSDIVYLESYILWKRKNIEWNEMDNEKIKEEIDSLLEMEKGYFNNICMNVIMMNKLLVDTEQNLFRIKCRHFTNTDKCRIFILASDNNFNKSFFKRLSNKIGADLKKEMPQFLADTLIEEKVDKKINKKEDYKIGVVKKYVDNLEKGLIIRKKDIIEGTNLKISQIDEVLKSTWGEMWKNKHGLKSKNGKFNGKYVI